MKNSEKNQIENLMLKVFNCELNHDETKSALKEVNNLQNMFKRDKLESIKKNIEKIEALDALILNSDSVERIESMKAIKEAKLEEIGQTIHKVEDLKASIAEVNDIIKQM